MISPIRFGVNAVICAVPIVWATRMDTGLVFMRRADFEAIDGYDERRHFAEDLDMLLRLRRQGRDRRQRLTRLRHVKSVTSTRKFDLHGDWHLFMAWPRLLWQMVRHRGAIHEFVQHYWYSGR